MDADYWKRAYQATWDLASAREKALSQYVMDTTGVELVVNGLGAESNKFISGSAASNGFTKGDADFSIPQYDIYIEVTGPLTDRVSINSELWIRPDKIENAIANLSNGHKTFIVHHCPSQNLWRCIAVNPAFVQMYANKHEFPMKYPTIRGRVERYVSISAHHRCIHKIEYMIKYIKACVQGSSEKSDGVVRGG